MGGHVSVGGHVSEHLWKVYSPASNWAGYPVTYCCGSGFTVLSTQTQLYNKVSGVYIT